MGLPHVVVRFYTNPDGRAARRTTLAVLGAARHLLRAAAGVRRPRPHLRADLVADGRADSWCSSCRRGWSAGAVGEVLTGARHGRRVRGVPLHSSGLTIAVAGVLSQDVIGRGGAPAGGSRPSGSRPRSRSSYPSCWRWPPRTSRVARTVGLAFAVTASTFCAAADARHLVARADARRRGRRARWSAGSARAPPSPGRCAAPPPPAGRRPPGPARRLVRAGSFLTMVVRLPAHPRLRARPRRPLHGPPPHPRGRRPRPRPPRPQLTSTGRVTARLGQATFVGIASAAGRTVRPGPAPPSATIPSVGTSAHPRGHHA